MTENINIKFSADTGGYTSNLNQAGKTTTAFGQAGTKAGRAVAAAHKEAQLAANELARAEQALLSATQATTSAGQALAAVEQRLAKARAAQQTSLNAVRRGEESLAKARVGGNAKRISDAEDALALRRARSAVAATEVAKKEAAVTAARAAGIAMSRRVVEAETSVAAASTRSSVALAAATQAANALGRGRLTSLRSVGRDFATIADSSEAVRSGLAGVATVAGGALAAGFGLALYGGVQLEKNMANVSTISKVVADDMAGYTNQIIELSRVVPQSAQELSAGLYDIVSSGKDGADAMTVLRASAEAASAGMTTTATSARAISAVLNAYGLSAAAATDVSDIMFQTVNKGVITFEELSQQLGDFVGVAAGAGVSFDDAASGLAAMTLSGIPAAQAATSLQNTMNKILKPADSMAAALNQIGYNSGAAALRTMGLKGTIDALAKSQGTAADTAMRLFPDIEAARGYLALTAAEGKNYASTFDAIADEVQRAGAAHKALEKQQETAAYRMEIAKNSVMALAIELGTALLPALKTATSLLQGFTDFMHDIPGPVRTALGLLIALSGAVLLAGAGFAKAQPLINGFRKQLELARTEASLLPKALVAASVALGVITAGLAAISIGYAVFASRQAEARTRTDELTRAIEAQNAGVANAVQNSLINTLVSEGDIDKLNKIGVEVNTFVKGVSGSAEEYQRALDEINDKAGINPFGDNNVFREKGRDVVQLRQDLKGLREAYERSIKDSDDAKTAQLNSARAAIKTGNAHDFLTATLGRNQQGNIELTESEKDLVKSMESFVDTSKAAAGVFTGVDYSAFAKFAKESKGSLEVFTESLAKSNTATTRWEADLAKASAKVGPAMAQQLRALGPDAAGLIHKIASATKPEVKALTAQFDRLAPDTKKSFAEWTAVIAQQIQDQRDYLNNLAVVSARGYNDIAKTISQITDPKVAAQAAASAVKASDAELAKFSDVLKKRIGGEGGATMDQQMKVLSLIASSNAKVTRQNVLDMFNLPPDAWDAAKTQLEILNARITSIPVKKAIQVLIDGGELSVEQINQVKAALADPKLANKNIDLTVNAGESVSQAQGLLNKLGELNATKVNPTITLPDGVPVSEKVAEIIAQIRELGQMRADPMFYLPGAGPVAKKTADIQHQIDNLDASSASIPVTAPGADPVADALGKVSLKIRGVDGKEVQLKVNTSTKGMPEAEGWFSKIKGIFGMAQGGVLHSFANGGESHVAQIAAPGAWRVWAEPETGGEAYIPLSPAKRGRSEAILEDVADRFGYSLERYASGGINALAAVRIPSSSPGADRTASQVQHLDNTIGKSAGAITAGWNRMVGKGMDKLLGNTTGMIGGAGYAGALAFARSQAGKPYQWAGVGNPSWDCSGFMSGILDVIRGQNPHQRLFATGAAGGPTLAGMTRDKRSPFMIGVVQGNPGHTAGTLNGVNVESRGGDGVIVGPGARGWNHPLFTMHYGLANGGIVGPRRQRKRKASDLNAIGPKSRQGDPAFDLLSTRGLAYDPDLRAAAQTFGTAYARGGITARQRAAAAKKKAAAAKAAAKQAAEIRAKTPRASVITDVGSSLDLGMRPTADDPFFDLGLYSRNLAGSVRVTQAWRNDLVRVSARAGEDVAAVLEDMGAEGVKLTHKMATGTAREVAAIAANLRKLAPEAKASLSRFNNNLSQETKRTAQFERDLVALASRGYGDLAKKLSESNDPEAAALARQAVKSRSGAAAANKAVQASSKLLGEDLSDLLTVVAAIKRGKAGIHAVADATGLGEDRIIEVGNRGLSQIRKLGAAAYAFRNDLTRANKHVAYAEGGMHVAQVAHTTRLWAEPETGGEAYIPLAGAKRERSTRILGDVARQFGYGLLPMANGGVVRGHTVDAVGRQQVVVVERLGSSSDAPLVGSLTIPLVGTNVTARDAAEEVMYQVRRARRGR